MSKKWLVDLNLNGNELQNVVMQNLASAPESPKEGMFYYNTMDKKFCLYENNTWVKYATLTDLTTKQNTLVSGTNIKSVNGTSLLGSGDLSTYPTQTGNNGKFLTTDGSAVSWATVNTLPSQADQSGKFLTTNGTTASWATAPVTSVNGSTGAVTVSTIQNQADSTQMLKLWVGSKADYDLIVTKDEDTLYYVQKEGEAIDIYEELDKKLDKLTVKPTAGTYTKVTINGEGQVTAGTSLAESDIPSLHLSKITDVTASVAEVNVLDGITATTAELNILNGVTASAAEINVLDGITATTTELNYVDGVTSSIQTQLNNKVGLNSLSIASASANYLTYDNTSGEFGANVDTTVTASSNNLVTSGAVSTAISNAIVGGVHYVGTWDITSATDYSGIALPQTKGALFYVTGTGPKTIGSIEWNVGDYLLFNDDVASGGTVTGKVTKIDNTESTDIVKLDATQTLTNKTIDADDNTISDLTTTNFKSGTVATSVAAASTAVDTKLPSEKAVRTELDKKQDLVTSATANDIAILDSTGQVTDSGKAFTTTVDIASSAVDTKIPTELAVRTAINSTISAKSFTATNSVLTPSSGVCIWEITNILGTANCDIVIRETSTGEEVMCDVKYEASKITVKMNATSDVAASTYTAFIHS